MLGPDMLIGVSTHGERQLLSAGTGPADYVAIGPVFATSSKQVPDPVVGLEGVRAARASTDKPLVAIGGINRANCAAVIEAGADSVAVISDLIPDSGQASRGILLSPRLTGQRETAGVPHVRSSAHGLNHIYLSQFSRARPSMRANSLSLSVTMVYPSAMACAAISRSLPPIDLPACSSRARISP